ncbi:leader peptidase (prepilin peptidase)/N-methyltransferase [Curtobacterium sp. PhB130]|uniref:prepilin peptidase n=1 Tax=unclassified Curtobacterium TaxID=257496 RepID=UPI000F4B0911|nr:MULTISPECIES: A24 family peptidase [unclassified Curtobacterium]ROS77555.1 leader peptidase (prepilin peptidase)/N-methyltransferase [Curtobacterium sp. PhB130]TCK66238.1 leader peptidase (prepilin peptidase)/N-methyltransferase [Curtobacterium sp. PhB136]
MTAALLPLIVMIVGLGAVLGLAIGSFLNVVVYRVPAGMSVVAPASSCPRCGNAIRGFDNVPVLSWLLLRGRCRDCSEPISVRYPLVEMATAVLFLVVAVRFLPTEATAAFDARAFAGHAVLLVALLYVMAVSVALAMIDLDTHTLPNRIVLPMYPVLAVLLAGSSVLTGDWAAFVRGLGGMAVLGGVYLLLAIAVPRGMGLGDVKLAGALGLVLAYLGWGPLAVGAFAAFLLGGTFGIGLVLVRRTGRSTGIPFGPWMLLGAWIGAFCGTAIWDAYLRLIGLA